MASQRITFTFNDDQFETLKRVQEHHKCPTLAAAVRVGLQAALPVSVAPKADKAVKAKKKKAAA